MGHTILILILYVLAAARLTRLINHDTITDPIRLAITQKTRDPNTTSKTRERWAVVLYWTTCPWCAGLWICIFTTWIPLYFPYNPYAQYGLIALAASHLIGIASPAADTENTEIVDD